MELKGILSISGYSGLFKLISQAKNSIIVESMDDKKRIPVYSTNKISPLDEIAVYSYEGEVQLKEILKKIYIKENAGETISAKSSPEELKKYMEIVLPNYDKEKVYISDIKKIISWYNQLHKLELLNFDDEKQESEPVPDTEAENISQQP
jgi:hypothetical protein